MNPDQNQSSEGNTQQPTQSVQPAQQPVQLAAQPMQPEAQSVQPEAQPVQQPVQPIQQPVQPLQPAQPQYIQPIQPAQPMGMGTGDIVLSDTGKRRDKKKLFAIIAAVVFGIVAVVLLVLSLRETMGGGEIVASNTKEAFNMYVNYFLTGEVSKEDIKDLEDEEEELEDETESEVLLYDDLEGSETVQEEVVQDGVVEEGVSENEETQSAVLQFGAENPYFNTMVGSRGDSVDEYYNNLRKYYDRFVELYRIEEEIGEDENNGFLDEYGNWLNIVATYYSGEGLSQATILKAYVSGGTEGAEDLINTEAAKYEGFEAVNGEDFSDLIKGYGGQELRLIMAYDKDGCVSGGEIDYDCLNKKPFSQYESVFLAKSKYSEAVKSALRSCVRDLNLYLYSLEQFVYEEEVEE